jgi:hypothetical protein
MEWTVSSPEGGIAITPVAEKNSSGINTTDVDFLFADTDLTLILNCKMYPLQMFHWKINLNSGISIPITYTNIINYYYELHHQVLMLNFSLLHWVNHKCSK